MNWKLACSAGTAGVLFGLIAYANAQVYQNKESIAVTIAASVLAASLGWLIGIALAPYSESEKAMFSTYGAAIVTFFTGFFASKLNSLADRIIDAGPSYIHHPESAVSILTVISTLIVTLIITFIFRRYAKIGDREKGLRNRDPVAPEAAEGQR